MADALSTVCVFFADGGLHKIVIHDDANYEIQLDDPAYIVPDGATVTLARAEWDALPPPQLVDGKVVFHDLHKAVVSKVAAANPVVGKNLQAIIDRHEKRMVDDAAARDNHAAFRSSLTKKQIALIAAKDSDGLLKSLSPAQKIFRGRSKVAPT